MEKVLIDSSVWISYFFPGDQNYKKAEVLVKELLDREVKILLPEIIFIEVINVLHRLDLPKQEIDQVKNLFTHHKKFKILHARKKFWLKKLEYYVNKTKLKTLDLLILGFTFEFKADKFYSFDRRLEHAYHFTKLL